MKALPNDCARCTSEHGCPLAATCRRTVAIPSGATLVIMSDFPGGDDCDGYWPEDNQKLEGIKVTTPEITRQFNNVDIALGKTAPLDIFKETKRED